MAVTTTAAAAAEYNLRETMTFLRRCSKAEELKQIHGRMLKTGLILDDSTVTKFLSFCLSSGPQCFLPYAQMVFDRLDQPNTFLWNLMIRGFSNSDEPERSLLLYRQMLSRLALLNDYTFPFLLKACSNLKPTIEHYGCMVDLLGRAGLLDEAKKLIDNMPLKPNAVIYGALLKATITIDGTIHNFYAGDRSHPELEEMPFDLFGDEREAAVHQHSERLAITYGLMKTKPGTIIRLMKNLRVCKDCHTVTKFISKIYKRDIIMRDRIRFHHFKDGKCSCGDYW